MLILNTKEDIIYTKVCPAIILAANRIARLNAFIIYENISMQISIGNKTNGASGINIRKKYQPCKLKPKSANPIDNDNENHKIKIK